MRRWRALRAVALAGAGLVLLSGCLKLDVNITVRSDDKLDGTVIVGVDKQVAALLPGGAANVGQLISNGGQPEISGAEDVKTAPFDDGKFVGQQITFKGAPLEAAGNTTGDLSIKHDADVYRLTGTIDLNLGDISNLPGNIAGGINPQEALANSVVHVQVNFPGKVQSSNGSNDGCSVSWEPKFGTTTQLDAVAKDSGSCSEGLRWWAWPLFGLGLLVLIGACIAIFRILKREREKDRKAAGTTGEDASGATGPAPPAAAGLAPPAVEGLAPPAAASLAPPPGTGLAPPTADEAVAADGETDWPPPGSNVPPPPDGDDEPGDPPPPDAPTG